MIGNRNRHYLTILMLAICSELNPTDSSKTGKNLTADQNRLTTVETTVMESVLR